MTARQIYLVYFISCLLGVESIPSPPTYPSHPLPDQDSSLGIVGGDAVNITEVPFMARYRSSYQPGFCGATIVHTRFVITSAACQQRFGISSGTYVTVGSDKAYRPGEDIDVKESYAHPLYDFSFFDSNPSKDIRGAIVLFSPYDIAVLKLAWDLNFNERVQPIALAERGFKIPSGSVFDVLGFGIMNLDLKMPKYLQKLSIPHVAVEKCKESYPFISTPVICAGVKGKGNCALDYGGPLVYKDMLLGVQTGIISCGYEDYPSVFTSISTVRDFIDNVMDS